MSEEKSEKRPTVMVGCRVPNGLELRVMKRRNEDYAVDGVTGVAAAMEDKGYVKLAGTTAGKPAPAGFTEVDKEVWDTWLAENKDSPLVVGGTVFVQEPAEMVEDRDELRGGPVKTGDSPHDPVEEKPDPEPTDVYDETYQANFKDPEGKEETSTIRGKTKDEVDGSKGK